MSTLFTKFQTKEKKVAIKALDNQEVTIRELTVAESNDFYKRIVGEPKADGGMNFDFKEIFSIRMEKVALAMVEPQMTLKDLKALSEGATEAINEIAEAIENFSNEGKKKK